MAQDTNRARIACRSPWVAFVCATTYASALIHAGLSVKTVQARLGHASATETLEVYSHLWPDSEDDTRAAIDGWLSAPTATAVRG